jgi:hypothetical protein
MQLWRRLVLSTAYEDRTRFFSNWSISKWRAIFFCCGSSIHEVMADVRLPSQSVTVVVHTANLKRGSASQGHKTSFTAHDHAHSAPRLPPQAHRLAAGPGPKPIASLLPPRQRDASRACRAAPTTLAGLYRAAPASAIPRRHAHLHRPRIATPARPHTARDAKPGRLMPRRPPHLPGRAAVTPGRQQSRQVTPGHARSEAATTRSTSAPAPRLVP